MGEAHNYEYTIYDEEPKPHTKKIYFLKWPKNETSHFLAILGNIFFKYEA